MSYWKELSSWAGFVVWSLLNLAVAAYIALFTVVMMSMKYGTMHSSNTAGDPRPGLTKEAVVDNVVHLTTSISLWLLIPLALFWALNYFIYIDAEWRRFRKAGLWVSCGCTFLLILAVIVADVGCLSEYPRSY